MENCNDSLCEKLKSVDKRETSEVSRERCKKSWTMQEDEQLRHFIKTYGKNWKKVTQFLPEKSSIQCRKRWNYTLNPEIKKSNWTITEDQILLSTQKRLGNRWSAIVKFLPGRVADDAKNRFAAIKRVENGTQKRYPKISENIIDNSGEDSFCMFDEKHVMFMDNARAVTGDSSLSYSTDSSNSCMASISGETDVDDASSIHSNNNNSLEVERNYESYQYYAVQQQQQQQQQAPQSFFNVPQQIILTATSLNHYRHHIDENKTITQEDPLPLLPSSFPTTASPTTAAGPVLDDDDYENLFELFDNEDEMNEFQNIFSF